MSAIPLTQSSSAASMSDRLGLVLAYIKQLPQSVWRSAVLVLAFLWLANSTASLVWLLVPLPNVPQPSKLAVPVTVQQNAGGTGTSLRFDDLATLAEVFGSSNPVVVAPDTTPVDESSVIDAETTKLKLKLHGILAAEDPGQGSAIISDGKDQLLYGVGDEIDGARGVKLAKVLNARVILDNKGNLESLWLFSEEDFSASARPDYSKSPRQNISSRNRTSPTRTSSGNGGDDADVSDNTTRTTARPDQIPKNVGDVVRFSVHRKDGKMVGYRIRPGRDRELFTQVGLKANDIVTSVNGIEVNDPKQIRSVYQSMKTATEAQLSVLRDGETHSISISLDTGG
ncbi:MAG: general secretion pathway protein C [Lentisphaeria bacterium]